VSGAWVPMANVYLVGETEAGPIKIGVCSRPKGEKGSRKLADIQYGNPRELFWLYSVKLLTEQDALAVETRFKRQLKAHWIRGEWFQLDLGTARLALDAAIDAFTAEGS
jgi:hypothetical protein